MDSENGLPSLPRTNGRDTSAAHVLMIPYPAQPHIIPMLDLAHQLCSVGDGRITITFVSFQPLIDRLLNEVSSQVKSAIHFVGVPDDLPGFNPPCDNPMIPFVLRESLQLAHNLEPFFKGLLEDRQNSNMQEPTCMVSDVINFWSIDTASKLKIPRYVLSASSACSTLTILSMSTDPAYAYMYDSNLRGPDDEDALICIPGLPPLHPRRGMPRSLRKDTPNHMRTLWSKSMQESAGFLVNTCFELESEVIEALQMRLPRSPVLSVGPLGQASSSSKQRVSMEGLQLTDRAMVTNWLDQQPASSVLYVSFGTTGMLEVSTRHVQELAKGLEASQQRFLWVLRAPPGHDVGELLPPGFEERVRGRALLVTGWAPQLLILSHPSTGGFLSSCGWNSSIESLCRGLPLIGWPTFADQPLIASYLESKLKVAVVPKQQDNYFVEADEFVRVVRLVFQSDEGRIMRETAQKFKMILAKAMAEGGSSPRNIQKFVDLIFSRVHN